MPKNINIISIFPQIFESLSYGVIGRFIASDNIQCCVWNPRDYSNIGGYVDDRPFGGGPGMIMSAPPLARAMCAINTISSSTNHVVYLSPSGKRLNNDILEGLIKHDSLTLLCGRYEGVDKRFCDNYVDEEISLGDFVLSGGEFGALVLLDAMFRLLPGCLGNEESMKQDSFFNGLLDHDHFTKPVEFEGCKVPDILLSGDHEKIEAWRLQQSLGKTWDKRPDLLTKKLDCKEKTMLLQYVANYLVTREDKP